VCLFLGECKLNNLETLITPQKTKYQVVYNLVEYELLGFLPSAWIVKCDKNGTPAYAEQRVFEQTINDFKFENTASRQQLFNIIDLLSVESLEAKYKPKKGRKKFTLEMLLEDKDIRKTIVLFVQRQLDTLLSIIVKNKYYLGINFDRREYLSEALMKYSSKTQVPNLFFKKTEKGIEYRFSFRDEDGPWKIRKKTVNVLTNNPGWVTVDNNLYKLQDVNGNMLKPFMNKDVLIIPKAHVKVYFQKFISRVVARATIEAEGFEVVGNEVNVKAKLEIIQNFLDSSYVISLGFLYNENQFLLGEAAQQKTQIKFDNEEVIVFQHKRKPKQEHAFKAKLEKLGLVNSAGSVFVHPDFEGQDDEYAAHFWIAKHKAQLKKAGFQTPAPMMREATVLLEVPKLNLNIKNRKDWFDLYGVVTIGGFDIPFIELADNIISDDRVFMLPNQKAFIIPLEWMTKYSKVFQMGMLHDAHLSLTKSQYTLLDELETTEEASYVPQQLSKSYKKLRYKAPVGLKATLRPYQLTGVKWLLHLYTNNLGGLLADDMGLGKTLQTIAVLLYAKEQKLKDSPAPVANVPVQTSLFAPIETEDAPQINTAFTSLILMPASLVYNWESEIRKFAPTLSVVKHIGSKRKRTLKDLTKYDVILTSYHTALKDKLILGQIEFVYLVLDESQQIKNQNSKIFAAVNQLDSEQRISLSGTPIENSLSDLWSQMQFINPQLLGDFRFFKKEFMVPIEKFDDESQKDHLKQLVSPYLLRRTKQEVAKDLPELTIKVCYSEMTTAQKKMYDSEKSAARNFIMENISEGPKINMMILSLLLKLRQIANHPVMAEEDYEKDSGKFQDIIHRMELIRKSNHKVLIFSQFVKHLNLFKDWLEKEKLPFAMLTGSTPTDKRPKEIKKFEENKEVQFFLISLKAGGAGLNLTAADYVFIADPWWNPQAEQQAIARAHRIGQDKNVIALKFITKDTIEEKILKLQEKKQQLADDIINNNNKIKFNETDIEYLLE